MNDIKDPQAALYAALAKFQAELPAIATNHEVKTEKYKYEYADLATVSEVVLPLLGRHGLAFTSRPTVTAEGKFVLAYKLVHEGGGSESGEYPLPTGAPQSVGSAITYARRYCLYAVTGVFPSGEDDDGQRAENGYRHQRGEAPQGREKADGRVTRPKSGREQAAQAKADLGDWGVRVDSLETREDFDKAKAELDEAHNAGRVDARRANAIHAAMKDRWAKVSAKQVQAA